jgi:hypothetical protein
MDGDLAGVADIIKQFADYLTMLISYLSEVFKSFTKKEKEEA